MMGFFSNLFAKQNCAVCGKECGTLHRSKLRDGQFLCDDCGNKCSKYIRLSELTLDEAKEHMEYMARMKRVFDEVFNKTEFRVNEYPSTPTQMGLVFCDELGMLYIDDRTGGRGKMPELIRYDLGEDFSIETAVVFGELYKNNGEWKFNAIGSGFQGGLAALCGHYGIDAE